MVRMVRMVRSFADRTFQLRLLRRTAARRGHELGLRKQHAGKKVSGGIRAEDHPRSRNSMEPREAPARSPSMGSRRNPSLHRRWHVERERCLPSVKTSGRTSFFGEGLKEPEEEKKGRTFRIYWQRGKALK